jgi:hypothetical protein
MNNMTIRALKKYLNTFERGTPCLILPPSIGLKLHKLGYKTERRAEGLLVFGGKPTKGK